VEKGIAEVGEKSDVGTRMEVLKKREKLGLC
jgi:hypothetical protein